MIRIFKSLKFAYFIFEGLSKGAIYLLFLYFNIFSNKFDYIALISIFSLEILYTIITPSYYAEGFFTIKWKNKKNNLYINSIKRSFIYFLLFTFISIVLWFNSKIYTISLFELLLLNFVVFGNVLNRIITIYLQSINKHKESLLFKTIAPLLSAILIFCLNFFIKNLVFSYLLGKFIAHLISLFYYKFIVHLILNNLESEKSVVIDKLDSDSFMLTSLLIGLLGWVSGVGFFKLVGLVSNNSNEIFNIATAINYIAFLQFSVSGTNQLYFSNLNSEIFKLGRHTLHIQLKNLYKFLFVFVFIFIIILFVNQYFYKFNFVKPFFLALVIFSINIFSYTINPIFYICNKLIYLLSIQIIFFLIFCIIFIFIYFMKFDFSYEFLYLFMFGLLNIPQFVLGYIYFDKLLISNKI